jgi:outer membrane protein assembly factor BamB
VEMWARAVPKVTTKARNRLFAAAVISAIALGLAACGQSENQGSYDIPAFGDRLMYVSGVDGYLEAIDRDFRSGNAEDGEDHSWRQAVGDELDLQPLVAGPVLYPDPEEPIVLVGSQDGNLYAYDAEVGGNPLWTFRTGDKIWSTPVIKDGIVYFGSHDKNVYAVNVFDGTEEWRFTTGGVVAGKPLLINGMVVIGSFDKNLYGLEADSGVKNWELKGENWFWAGATANERTIFAPNMDGNIYAVDTQGNLLWKYDLGSAIVSRPAIVTDALVVAAKNGRQITLLDTKLGANNADRMIDSEFVTNAEIKAPLFVNSNTVYVGTQGSTIIRLDIFTNRAGRPNLEEAWCWDTKSKSPCE